MYRFAISIVNEINCLAYLIKTATRNEYQEELFFTSLTYNLY